MPTKPTDTRTSAFPELDDFEGILKPKKVNPLSKIEPEPERHRGQTSEPGMAGLRRASSADTASATSNISLSGHMRDLLNRLPDELGADEVDDDEFQRQRTTHGHARPEPRVPGTDLVTRQNLVHAAGQAVELQDQRSRGPKWHAVIDLPGNMSRRIRAMGRDVFGAITRTPVEQIVTIANLGGQGPNTIEEVEAVKDWLENNAQYARDLTPDFSRLLPGYEPKVDEYTAKGIRFHVVEDPEGVYIYAYPEQDAKEFEAMPHGIGHDRGGFPGPMRENIENKKMTSLSDEIRNSIQLLESIQDDADALNEMMDDLTTLEAYRGKASKARYMDPEAQKARMSRHSSLAPMLSKVPGGPRLISWLHKNLQLASQADWGEERAQRYYEPRRPVNSKTREPSRKNISPTRGSGIWSEVNIVKGKHIEDSRVMWEVIKSNPDNFIVFIGENGCGAARPKPGYIEAMTAERRAEGTEYNPAKDRNLKYIYAFFTDTQQWINTNPTDGGMFDPDTGKYTTRGGMVDVPDTRGPNMLDIIKGMIGKIKEGWSTYPAELPADAQSVEREKISQRAAQKATPVDNRSDRQLEVAVFQKIKPVIGKLVANAASMINRRAQRLINGGNWEGAQQVAQAGIALNALKVQLEDPAVTGIPSNISTKFSNALIYAAREHQVNVNDSEDMREFLQAASSRAGAETKSVLNAFRHLLVGAEVQE